MSSSSRFARETFGFLASGAFCSSAARARGRELLPGKEVLLLIDHDWILHRRLNSVPKNDSCLKSSFGRSHGFLLSIVVFATYLGHQLASERAVCFGVELCVAFKVKVKIGSHHLTDFHSFEQCSEHCRNKILAAD